MMHMTELVDKDVKKVIVIIIYMFKKLGNDQAYQVEKWKKMYISPH